MRPEDASKRCPGLAVPELLAVLAVLGLVLLVSMPALAELGSAARTAAAARQMALTFQALRWKSVAGNTGHGLLFQRDSGGWYWYEVQDGNRNGLRTAEVGNGTDRTLSGPHRLPHYDRGITLGFLAGGPIPRIPPRRGWIGSLGDPIQFGRPDLVSFSPLGTSSSGTLYITDGRNELFGVLLFGPTARVRVWRYSKATGRWSR